MNPHKPCNRCAKGEAKPYRVHNDEASVEGFGFRVQGLASEESLGFRVEDLGFGFRGLGFRVQRLRFRGGTGQELAPFIRILHLYEDEQKKTDNSMSHKR